MKRGRGDGIFPDARVMLLPQSETTPREATDELKD
jgi:hypothetical protein